MAPTPKTVTVDALKAAATNYNTVLSTLPSVVLAEKLALLGFRQLSEGVPITNTEYLRKANLIKPYQQGNVKNNNEVGSFRLVKLTPETVYASVKDNVTNYDGTPLLGSILTHDPKLKKLPIEAIVLGSIAESVSEDFIFCAIHGVRDLAGTNGASDAFDGINRQITNWLTAGEIDASKGNLISTGACPNEVAATNPAKPGDAFKWCVAFLRQLNPILLKSKFSLQMSSALKLKLQDSCNALYPQFQGVANLLERLRYAADAPQMDIVSDFTLGGGDALRAVVPGWADFSLYTSGSEKFISVRNPYEDPNDVQFWLQSKVATRLNAIHKKVFAKNDQSFTSIDFRGDY